MDIGLDFVILHAQHHRELAIQHFFRPLHILLIRLSHMPSRLDGAPVLLVYALNQAHQVLIPMGIQACPVLLTQHPDVMIVTDIVRYIRYAVNQLLRCLP